MGKENHRPLMKYTADVATFPEPNFHIKPSSKRTLMEAAPLFEKTNKRQRTSSTAGDGMFEAEHATRPIRSGSLAPSGTPPLPEPHEMPALEDDGLKPPYSYAILIGMAILRAPNRRLTLAQIYKWISDNFAYYRSIESGWQNSIRHNLSLNKAFIKQERPKDDPGKGNYWAIEPGMEHTFLKDKPVRRGALSSVTLSGPLLQEVPPPSSDVLVPELPPSSAQPTVETGVAELAEASHPSSDATVPASDPALQEDDEDNDDPRGAVGAPHSSPPPVIRSSPPVLRHHNLRGGTPPRRTALHPSSGLRKKRKAASMNDSGYFSSLESSAMRPRTAGNILTSEADIDRPRIKRGRAEEEIARIRGSSHDISPSKAKLLRQPRSQLLSSSPLRHDSSLMLPPLTPANAFKMPAKPPASVSPNTNLRNHRKKIKDLVGSPDKGYLNENLSFSPAFKWEEDLFPPNDSYLANFDVFADAAPPAWPFGSPLKVGSPEKRSIKRPRLGPAPTSGNVLGDVTGSSKRNRLSTPSLAPPFFYSPIKSPSKGSNDFTSTPKGFSAAKDDLFGLDLLVEQPGDDDAEDDDGGLDILQEFKSIGSRDKENARTPIKAGSGLRPGLGGRS